MTFCGIKALYPRVLGGFGVILWAGLLASADQSLAVEATAAAMLPAIPCASDLDGLAYQPLPPIEGDGACGIPEPLEITAVDGITLDPPAQLSCRAAIAFRDWSRDVLVPAADTLLDTRPARLRVYASYVCRGRNRNPDAKLSEHALGNAIDIGVVIMEDGTEHAIAPRDGEKTPESLFQRAIRVGACTPFSTVLGPGADAYHDDHLHFDVAQRRNGYKLCQ